MIGDCKKRAEGLVKPAMTAAAESYQLRRIPASGRRPRRIERVQVGVRLEKRLVKVLKGLAEFEGVTLGQLLEKIILHSFEPMPGEEGEMAASPPDSADASAQASGGPCGHQLTSPV